MFYIAGSVIELLLLHPCGFYQVRVNKLRHSYATKFSYRKPQVSLSVKVVKKLKRVTLVCGQLDSLFQVRVSVLLRTINLVPICQEHHDENMQYTLTQNK